MDGLHNYVPTTPVKRSFESQSGIISYDDLDRFPVLFSGDQLTAQQTRKSIALRCNEDTTKLRLEGLIPVVEDWHARQCLMKMGLHVCVTHSNNT